MLWCDSTRFFSRHKGIWSHPNIFPDKTVTARAAESRMGSGKGAVEYWVAIVKPGTVLFELSGITAETAKKALKLASYKLPIKTKIITKH